jgi:hypothetical protein
MSSRKLSLHRRRVVLTAAAAALWPAIAGAVESDKLLVEIWKSPACSCCGEWIKHLEANGFAVKTNLVSDTAPIRSRVGFDPKYASCHTALVQGYALEGHVPVREIRRLLKEKPGGVVGLAVPGMPLGAPGMDLPSYGGRKTPYDVVLVKRDGTASVYQGYR